MALEVGTAPKRSVLYPGRSGDFDFGLPAIAASVDVKRRFRTGAKVCSVPIMVVLVIAALGPAKWVPRTELGWQFDHFICYFGVTLFFFFAWPRPLLVGGVFMVVGALLEGLQVFTPDRGANLVAALCGAGGALAAALIAELFIRAFRRRPKPNVRFGNFRNGANSFASSAARLWRGRLQRAQQPGLPVVGVLSSQSAVGPHHKKQTVSRSPGMTAR